MQKRKKPKRSLSKRQVIALRRALDEQSRAVRKRERQIQDRELRRERKSWA